MPVCSVCTIAVCAGVGLSRWLGVDDLVSGVWIGGLVVTLIIWLLSWLRKRRLEFKFQKLLTVILVYLTVLVSLSWGKIIGQPENKICFTGWLSVDKLVLGILIGSFVFQAALATHNLLKQKNRQKSFFPFQKVVIPILFLLLTSLICYLLIK